MKIVHIITRLIVGGAQENTLLTCEGLARRGHEVILLTGPSPGPEGSLMERARRGGYEVRVTPHLVRSPHPWHDYLAYLAIGRLCRGEQPDIVHTHSSKAGIIGRAAAWKIRRQSLRKPPSESTFPPPSPPPTVASKDLGGPLPMRVVHTIHGLAFHPWGNWVANRAWVTLERWAAKRCDAIVSVADAMTRQALAEGIGREGQYRTIYSGMDVAPFVAAGTEEARREVRGKLGIAEERVVFGTIARLQPLKGHDDVLAVAGRVFEKVPGAHFLWVGDGVFRGRFEAMIREKGWEGKFTLVGLVRPEEVGRYIGGMDVVVHPSYREGLARALPQGLLAGKAVISYDCDGAGEVCVDGVTGRLVKTGDAAGLAEAMVWMAEHEAERVAMGAAGQRLCMERFAADVMVERIESLYRELLGVRAKATI